MLNKRTDVNGLDGYYFFERDGIKYSVVDFGTTMKTHPYPAGIFKGWEAMRLSDTKSEYELIRADSWEELEKKL